ncbi:MULTISPECIES: S8 family serine peptidase [unclassified Pseudoalteromonas]|uniref:S8 family peptidase n=1 Tax=unclassified Pseudoalteromonas TaxID=194690 RepID=UPI0005A73A39|nr:MULTISPECIES: S8 family serine peptidase [unclassified Pseudoalteromonas]
MIKKYLALMSLVFMSYQVLANNTELNSQESIVEVNSLYYEIKDKKHLSKKNEFNTQIEELEFLEVTPYWINQTNLDGIPQPSNYKLKVCIIDSGVDSGHTDLPKVNINGYDTSYSGFWGRDSVGHGTHISGIISALSNDVGVRGAIDNGQVDIHIQKLMRSARGINSTISDNSLIEAIEICAGTGAKIINLSLSGAGYSEKLRNVIDRLTYQDDIIFIAAAGNHGTATGIDMPAYPAAYRNVVGVGAININGDLADFSPSYRGITFVAPGVDILSTVSHDNIKVNSVYYKSEEGYYEFDYSQIDNGNFEYSSTLPTASACYYNLSDNAVTEQIIENKLSVTSKKEIQNASRICESEGGSLLVISYNYLDTVDREEFAKYNSWLTSLDYEATMPTLLMPGLNDEEVSFFQEGNVSISSGKQSYAALTGTSQAAGVAAAGIAKLWANFPNTTAEQVLNSVKNTASSLNENYPDNAVGYGAVNFSDAYSYLQDYNNVYISPSCPELWYDNQSYEKNDSVTFNGIVYEANYWTKNQLPSENSGDYAPWNEVRKCDDFDNNTNESKKEYVDPAYSLKEIERITVTYKCESYTLSCGGGGGFSGFGGFNFGGGYSGGGGYSEGGSGGGAGSNNSSDKEKEAARQKEYDDIKKRADNQPKQKPGESKEDYNKRLSQYYKKVASDLKKWDDKYQKGRHTQKIIELNNRANKYDKAYQNAKRHREVTQRYNNGNKGKSSLCKTKTRGVVKVIQTIGCLFDEP